MARLNDVPQPAGESLDALKRRFIRQNRELARVNSTQSVRIRNLESEVSRLLSENVSLREQVIKLHYEVDNNTGSQSMNRVDGVKTKLEGKLAELGDLLRELGEIKSNATKQRPQRRRSLTGSSPRRSPNQRDWKNRLTLSEVTGETDGRLPPIIEDKCFPRRTLDSDEIIAIFADQANLTDSPDLGPPPVAHFEEGDPIKFDSRQNQPKVGPDGALQPPNQALSTNLETRKKRRESFQHKESGLKKNDAVSEDKTPLVDRITASGQPLKSGAKRKLNVGDDEEQTQGGGEKDDYQSGRRSIEQKAPQATNTKSQVAAHDKTTKDKNTNANITVNQTTKEKTKDASIAGISTSRKALGPKSVNSDPQSPAKLSKAATKEELIESKDDLATRIRNRSQSKDKVLSNKPVKSSKGEGHYAPKSQVFPSAEPPPETPIPPGLDLFSPTTSEPSAARSELRDTPPPPDLGPDTGTGSFGRASRRPRGSVSYAEPNLRDKMRRPTKDLVDAVGAEERARQEGAKREGSVTFLWSDSDRPKLCTDAIKQEEDNDAVLAWKTKPVKDTQGQQLREKAETTSPLGKKAQGPATELPASVITDRRRRASTFSKSNDEKGPVQATSGAASAIAALPASSTGRSKRRDEDKGLRESEIEEVMPDAGERTSIFDFTGSSPEDLGKKSSSKEEGEIAKATRTSRRHSTISSSLDSGRYGPITVSRKPERRTEAASALGGEEEVGTGKADLKSAKSVVGLGTGSAEEVLGRGERAASRRRSMML